MEVKYNIRYSMEDDEFDFIELKLSSNSNVGQEAVFKKKQEVG